MLTKYNFDMVKNHDIVMQPNLLRDANGIMCFMHHHDPNWVSEKMILIVFTMCMCSNVGKTLTDYQDKAPSFIRDILKSLTDKGYLEYQDERYRVTGRSAIYEVTPSNQD